jgi:hypothetical protein
MCEEVEELSQEEFEVDAEETRRRGPYAVRRETKHWKDFMGRNRSRTTLVVVDASGVKVGSTESGEQAYRWALELTVNGFAEE